jgi:glycosyltransferase involved in cell wall biosynthesis
MNTNQKQLNDYTKVENISVIVPIYNMESRLKKCINSILKQTHKDIQLILVNDGSSDKSLEICHAFQKKDKRVLVINKPNSGVSSSRNAGIKTAEGKYTMFVDADDTITVNAIELLYNDIILTNAKIACAQLRNTYLHKKAKSSVPSSTPKIYSCELAIRNMLYHKGIYVGPCAKLYATSLLKNCLFNELYEITEDLDFNYRVFKKADIVCFNEAKIYNYLQHPDSATHNAYNNKRMQAIKISKDILANTASYDSRLVKPANNMLFMMTSLTLFGYYKQMPKTDLEICIESFKSSRGIVLFDLATNYKIRSYSLLSYIGVLRMVKLIVKLKALSGVPL